MRYPSATANGADYEEGGQRYREMMTIERGAVPRGCILVALAVLLLSTVVVVAARLTWDYEHRGFLSRVKKVRTASSEAQVRALLGEPIAIHEAGRPVNWDAEYSAYGHPREWIVERKVLVFLGPADYIVFVHLGSDRRVKDVYVGGT